MTSEELWAETLTPSQAKVVALVAEGLGTKQIAARLIVANSTVKFHISSALERIDKIGEGRMALARWWWENVELPLALERQE